MQALKTFSRRGFLLVASALVAAAACSTKPVFPPPLASREAPPLSSPPEQAPAEEWEIGEFRVATYNADFSRPSPNAAVEAISRCRADVVVVQEFDPAHAQSFKEQLRHQYPHVHLRARGCLALFSREPLLGVQHHRLSRKGYGALVTTVRMGGELVTVAALSLWPYAPGETGGSGRAQRRVRELAALTSELDLSRPTIIAGDFGSLPSWTAATLLDDLGMKSTHHLTGGPGTFSADRGRPDTRLDYVFYSEHFEAVSEHVADAAGSDHYPLVADLRWKGHEGARRLSGTTA